MGTNEKRVETNPSPSDRSASSIYAFGPLALSPMPVTSFCLYPY